MKTIKIAINLLIIIILYLTLFYPEMSEKQRIITNRCILLLAPTLSVLLVNIKKKIIFSEIFPDIIGTTLFFMIFFLCSLIYADKIITKNGVSIIALCEVTKSSFVRNMKVYDVDFIFTIGNDTIRKSFIGGCDYHKKKHKLYVKWCISNVNSLSIKWKQYPTNADYEFYGNFAFCDKEYIYTYHDYSLLNPDLVYYNVGYNILYKSIKEKVNDSIINLSFTEIDGTPKKVSFKPNYDISNIDTFLVFKNINEKFEDTWHVCSPEINTPENWAKISDYGYIFHNDVYGKHAIEDSCSQIRNYVLKYKEHL